MNQIEKEVLDTLRKSTLAYLSEFDYAQIEKAVEQQGILNLTGTASAIVKSAVQKHGGGSHDQSSHGNWANGSGGSSGGSSSVSGKSDNNETGGGGGLDSLSTKSASIKNKLNKFDAEKLSDYDVKSRNRAVKFIDRANKHLADAKNKSGSSRDSALSRAQDALAYAFEELDGADSTQLQNVSESIGMLEEAIGNKMG